MAIKTEIHLCHDCKGVGIIYKDELVDYHRREYREWTVLCTTCKGHGRLKKTITFTETTEPYCTPEPEE